MKKRILYQTLEDRHNNVAVETNGPGYCSNNKAWLCEGYYFWDASIDTAKWWGKRTYANAYVRKVFIVCQTAYDYGGDNFFDLVGDTDHRKDFWDAVDEVEKAFPGKFITVAFVLALMREDDVFSKQFMAVRAYPNLSRKGLKQLFFEEGNPSFIEKDPPIQMCIWDDYKSFIKEPFTVVGNYSYQQRWYRFNR